MPSLRPKTDADLEVEREMSNVSGEAADIKAQEKVVAQKDAAYDAARKALQGKRAEIDKFEEDVLVPIDTKIRKLKGSLQRRTDHLKRLPGPETKEGSLEKSSSKNDAVAEAAVGADGEIRSLTSKLEAARKDLEAQEAVLNGENGMRSQETALENAADEASKELDDSEELLEKMQRKKEWMTASAAAESEAQTSSDAGSEEDEGEEDEGEEDEGEEDEGEEDEGEEDEREEGETEDEREEGETEDEREEDEGERANKRVRRE